MLLNMTDSPVVHLCAKTMEIVSTGDTLPDNHFANLGNHVSMETESLDSKVKLACMYLLLNAAC